MLSLLQGNISLLHSAMSDSDSSPPKFRKPLPKPKRPVPPSPGACDSVHQDLARPNSLPARHVLLEDQAKEDKDGASVSASDESEDDRRDRSSPKSKPQTLNPVPTASHPSTETFPICLTLLMGRTTRTENLISMSKV